nr:PREDICTED: odorant receptor 22c-like [Linepithema humile]
MATSTISPSLKIGLRLLGVWPDVSYSTVYWVIYMSSLLIIQYFQYLYVFTHFKLSELSNLVDSLPMTLDYSLSIFKLTSLWLQRRIMQQILIAMDKDWRECMDVNQYLYVMTIKANVSHFFSNTILSFYGISGVFYVLGDYAIHIMHLVSDNNDTLRQLPMKVQLPFETEQSPIFEVLVVTLFLHVMANSFTIALLNGLIFSLVLHVSGQIDIICEEFRIISEKILLYESSASTLRTLIERHNKVILFSDNIEKLFSFIALMQVVWNTLVMCCLGFIIIISIHNEGSLFVLIKTILAYIAMMIEAFIFCFAGEYLSLKSNAIAEAAYDVLWYNLPSNQSKIIIFVIMRSYRRLTITAGKIMDLSLETFASSSTRNSGSYK